MYLSAGALASGKNRKDLSKNLREAILLALDHLNLSPLAVTFVTEDQVSML